MDDYERAERIAIQSEPPLTCEGCAGYSPEFCGVADRTRSLCFGCYAGLLKPARKEWKRHD